MTREFLDDLRQDAAFAIRQLLRARSFTTTAIATLAIGIGAAAAVFSLLNAVVLQPLAFRAPDRIVDLHPSRNGSPIATASGLEFTTWRALPGVFAAAAAYTPGVPLSYRRTGLPSAITANRASADLTRVLGVAPELGREFTAADDAPGAPAVVLLSHGFWLEQFHGDPGAIGQTVQLDEKRYTVIGVLPASVDQLSPGDAVWIPLALASDDLLDFKARRYQLVGRLASGVTPLQASAALDASERRLAAEYPMWGKGYGAVVRLLSDDLIGNLRSRLFILLGAVGLVFLIACVNVANLLLVRGGARSRELAIRAALGAARVRLLRQLFTETTVLAFVSGLVGVALSAAMVRAVIAVSPPGVPRLDQAHVDGAVLGFAFAVSAACSAIVGVLPAFKATLPALDTALRRGARGSGESRASERGRSVLMAGEVALAVALLSAAALLIRTAWAISRVDPGFESRGVLTAQVLLPRERYADLASGVRAYRAIDDGVRATPGITDAALTSSLPLGGGVRAGIGAEGQPLTDGERLIADLRMVTPHYFSTLKIRLTAGRDFTDYDRENAPNVAIINETLAKLFWPGQSAIGKRIEGMDPSHQHFMRVIGVIADERDISLEQTPTPEFFIPFEQMPAGLWSGIQGSLTIVARTAPAAATLERPIRAAVASVDPGLPIANVSTMDALVSGSRATSRFNLVLLAVLGGIALILASVGVYGVVAYSVTQRGREIGLRMALGATPAAIGSLVARRALIPIAFGAAAGGGLSVFTTRLLRDQLYGVHPGDPGTLAAIVLLLVLVSLVATGVPVRRAMRVSPATALAG